MYDCTYRCTRIQKVCGPQLHKKEKLFIFEEKACSVIVQSV